MTELGTIQPTAQTGTNYASQLTTALAAAKSAANKTYGLVAGEEQGSAFDTSIFPLGVKVTVAVTGTFQKQIKFSNVQDDKGNPFTLFIVGITGVVDGKTVECPLPARDIALLTGKTFNALELEHTSTPRPPKKDGTERTAIAELRLRGFGTI